MSRTSRTWHVAAPLALLLAAASLQHAAAQTIYDVIATGRTNGTAPEKLGMSLGHGYVNSNWLMWWDRLGVNYARLFVNTRVDVRSSLGAAFGNNLDGKAVTSKSSYAAAIAGLRTPAGHDPNAAGDYANPIPYRWFELLDQPKSSYEALGAPSDILNKMRQKGVTALVVLQLTCATATRFALNVSDATKGPYWGERWELYKYVYYFGVWAYNHGVENVEIYNEPNLDAARPGCSSVNTFWPDNVSIRSRALQDAYADRQKETSTSLQLTVIGPPMSNPNYVGTLGQVAVKNNRRVFSGNPAGTGYTNLGRYSYHVAGGTGGYFFGTRYAETKGLVQKDFPGLPTDITEYAVESASGFEKVAVDITESKLERNDTMDDPAAASRFASITAYLLRANVPRLGVFKFSQTASTVDATHQSGVLKNGLMYADNSAAPFDVGDSTLAAEAHSLIARKLAPKQALLEVTTPKETRSPFTAFGTSNANSYFLYVVNDDVVSRKLAVNLAKWANIPVGSSCIVNQVSAGFRAEVAAVLQVPSSRKLAYMQSSNSLVQFVCPKAAKVPTVKNLAPTGDATVTAGANSGKRFGAAKTLSVRLSGTSSQDTTSAALLKFSLAGINPAKVQAAVLKLRVASSGTTPSPLLVFAVGNSSRWNQASVTWNTAPALKPLTSGLVNRISGNYIDHSRLPAPRVAGHISVAAGTANAFKSIDVTDTVVKQLRGAVTAFERNQTSAAVAQDSSQLSFLISRIVRRNPSGTGAGATKADPVGDNNVAFHSSEATTASYRPVLTLYLTA